MGSIARNPASSRRTGFTLIELLVVIAIIGILIALLLPAVQKIREAAARIQCQNNLHQIGLAMHNYHDANSTFPSGHYVTGPTNGPYLYYANWAILLLPYVEQGPLYNQYDNTVPNTHARNVPVVQTYVKIYTCPTDPNANRILTPESKNDGATPTVSYMTGSYRGMSGVSATGFDQWAGYPTEIVVNQRVNAGYRGVLHTDGPATGLTAERLTNISDGTSNTLVIGERTTRTHPTRGTFWADSFNLYSLGGAFNQSAALLDDYDACSRVASDIAQCKYGWGSTHTNGGINFVFGDGSVHTIQRNIDMRIFLALATIANGEVIPDF
jgi:prepilin-type N-terminal cleavage/methylation domain-containing protein/prepilin-type processing-associated H-X9-DG protein